MKNPKMNCIINVGLVQFILLFDSPVGNLL